MYSLNSATAPWAPFSARPRKHPQRIALRNLVVRADTQNNEKDVDSLAKQLGKACAPFAAALLLMAQAPAVHAAESVESQFESSARRLKEFGSSSPDVASFFKKAKDSATQSDSALSSPSVPSPPSAISNLFSKFQAPSAGEKSVADKASGAKANVEKSSQGGFAKDEIPANKQQPDTLKPPTPQSEAASEKKIEEYTKKEAAGDAPTPKLDPSPLFDEPEPKKAPDTETKLPEQPRPEPASSQLGKDSSGGKVQDTKSGSGALDSFGGGPSGQSPSSKAGELVEQAQEQNGLLDFIQKGFGTEQSSLPDPKQAQEVVQGAISDISEDEIPVDQQQPDTVKSPTPQSEAASEKKLEEFTKKEAAGDAPEPKLDPSPIFDEPEPKKAPDTETKLPEQPRPEPADADLGKDSSGGKVQDTKSSEGALDSFGGGPSGESPSSKADKLVEKSKESGGLFNFFKKGFSSSNPQEVQFSIAELEAPQPSALEEKEPESSPGSPNTPPEQPKPESEPPSALGSDTAGGKTQDTKSGSGTLDFFGGPDSGDADKAADKNVQKAASSDLNNVGDVAFEPQDAGPKLNEQAQVAPQTAPNPAGVEKPVPEEQKKQNISPSQTAPEPAQGTTETPSVSDAGFIPTDALPRFDELALTAELGPPGPTPIDETEPSSAPGEPNEIPDQPKPEGVSKTVPQDNAGGETQDTKSGSGSLDFFGGSDSGDSEKAAEKNIQKAASFDLSNKAVNEVAQTAEEEGPDELKATAIGIGAALVGFIAILNTYGGEETSKHH